MAAAIGGHAVTMRSFALASTLALAAAPAAYADPTQDARSAVGACLSAVIDNAPVGDIDVGDVAIRRGKDPVSCTVEVRAGQPVVVRDAVIQTFSTRPERLFPAKSRWDPETFASRDTFCNLPGRRNVMASVSTGKPGTSRVLVATITEMKDRDPRCDRDEGLQKNSTPTITPGPAG